MLAVYFGQRWLTYNYIPVARGEWGHRWRLDQTINSSPKATLRNYRYENKAARSNKCRVSILWSRTVIKGDPASSEFQCAPLICNQLISGISSWIGGTWPADVPPVTNGIHASECVSMWTNVPGAGIIAMGNGRLALIYPAASGKYNGENRF